MKQIPFGSCTGRVWGGGGGGGNGGGLGCGGGGKRGLISGLLFSKRTPYHWAPPRWPSG